MPMRQAVYLPSVVQKLPLATNKLHYKLTVTGLAIEQTPAAKSATSRGNQVEEGREESIPRAAHPKSQPGKILCSCMHISQEQGYARR